MTSYSVLRSSQRATIVATWPGEWSDHSANVTTVSESCQASELAHILTRLSEDAWDAAAFLDTSVVIETGINAFIEQLRSSADEIHAISVSGDGFRHTIQWSFTDAQGCWQETRRQR